MKSTGHDEEDHQGRDVWGETARQDEKEEPGRCATDIEGPNSQGKQDRLGATRTGREVPIRGTEQLRVG